MPVHNGAKYLDKTLKRLLKQQYDNFEVILVENNSIDDSWKICQEFQKKDNRIRAYKVVTKGTTLARKYGVLQSEGTYILFHDQDDKLVNSTAIENMVHAIKEDDADICQFGYFKTLRGLAAKKKPKSAKEHIQIFNREQIMDNQIKGILGFGWSSDIIIGSQVWNKIYKADLLKDAVININESLYFCEDVYLNMFAFFNQKTEKVSVRNEYYYCWNTGIGFSSSEAARMTFLRDYQYIKQASIPLIKEFSTQKVLLQAHWDSLTVYKWAIYSMLYDQMPKDQIIEAIKEIEEYQYIQEAKRGLKGTKETRTFKDIDFLTSEYSPAEYYNYCRSTLPSRSPKRILKEKIKKTAVSIMKRIGR